MLKTHISRSIDRSPQDVFDFVADPANNSAWQAPTEAARWTSDGPPGVGSPLNSVARFLGRTMEFDYKVTVWDPPRALAFESVEGSIPFRATWSFEPDGKGGTNVTLDMESEIAGVLKVAERLIGKPIERQLKSDVNALKRELE